MMGKGGKRWADRGLVSGEKREKDERGRQLERCTDSVVTATIDTWCCVRGQSPRTQHRRQEQPQSHRGANQQSNNRNQVNEGDEQ